VPTGNAAQLHSSWSAAGRMFHARRPGRPYDGRVDSPRRFIGGLICAALLPALCAAPPAAADHVVGTSGKTGVATTYQGSCRYMMFPSRGILRVGVSAPSVSGANTRRRTRRESTYVRYRIHLTAAYSFALLATSTWSDFIPIRQSQMRTWSGPETILDGEWSGIYGADVHIEWWNSKRRVGWRTYRTTAFRYFNQYNAGPFGPITYCYRIPTPVPTP
jgi:hypothetical protein